MPNADNDLLSHFENHCSKSLLQPSPTFLGVPSSQLLKMRRCVSVCAYRQGAGSVRYFPTVCPPASTSAQTSVQQCWQDAWWPLPVARSSGNVWKTFQLILVTWPAPLAAERAGQVHPWHTEEELSPLRIGPSSKDTSFATISCQKKKKEIHKCVRAFGKGLHWPRAGGKFIFLQRSLRERWLNCPVHWRVLEKYPVYEQKFGAHLFFFFLPFLSFLPSFLLLTLTYYLPQVMHCPKYFTYINSFNPQHSLR